MERPSQTAACRWHWDTASLNCKPAARNPNVMASGFARRPPIATWALDELTSRKLNPRDSPVPLDDRRPPCQVGHVRPVVFQPDRRDKGFRRREHLQLFFCALLPRPVPRPPYRPRDTTLPDQSRWCLHMLCPGLERNPKQSQQPPPNPFVSTGTRGAISMRFSVRGIRRCECDCVSLSSARRHKVAPVRRWSFMQGAVCRVPNVSTVHGPLSRPRHAPSGNRRDRKLHRRRPEATPPVSPSQNIAGSASSPPAVLGAKRSHNNLSSASNSSRWI